MHLRVGLLAFSQLITLCTAIFSSVSRVDILWCEWKIHVSSAKRWNFTNGDTDRCCLYVGGIVGAPRTFPCGTPHVTVYESEIHFPILTLWVLSVRQDLNKHRGSLLMLYYSSLLSSMSRFTVSKAFGRSWNMQLVFHELQWL